MADAGMDDTYDAIATEISALWRRAQIEGVRQILIGFAGPPGAGKTTTVTKLSQRIPGSVCLPMDGYHLTKAQLQALQDPDEAFKRRGAHWTFDGIRFLRDLELLRSTGEGSFPSFDHAVGDPVLNAISISADQHPIVLVEGNYLLLEIEPWVRIKSLLDFSYFIHCDIGTIEERVRLRHIFVGSSPEEAAERVRYNDSPNAALVLASRARADKVIHSI